MWKKNQFKEIWNIEIFQFPVYTTSTSYVEQDRKIINNEGIN
jgi:hypothetical protein